jgi:glycolate dehydrogenase FAD-binding subunit
MAATVDGVTAAEVARPADVDAVREIVRSAARAGKTIVATGLGAHLDVGAPPRRVDVLLDLGALDRIVDHEAADMTVTVQAGCSLAQLDATLSAAGQWLPLDPPAFERTTVGGLIAANLSGPLRASRGTVRDLLLGLRLVDGTGALVSGGGKVVKNVAGYDLPKLHVGALGTLGVVLEATFKVQPRPEREAAAIFPTATHADAAAIALDVRDRFDPLWLEAGSLDGAVGVAVGVAGIAPEIAAVRETLDAIARDRSVELRWVDDGARLRRTLTDFPVRERAAVLRASVLPTDVGATMTRIRELAGDVPVLAHASNGVVRARLADRSNVSQALTDLRRELAARGGFVVVERASPEVKAGLDVWGDPGEGLALMRRVKETFDPHGTFSPGRYVGGL